jgi:hypothetical protein
MKKLMIILAIILGNLFYYNFIHISDGSMFFVTVESDEAEGIENIINVLSTKKVAYIRLYENYIIGVLTSNTKITVKAMDEDELEEISSFMKMRSGIVKEKSIFVGIGSIIAIFFVLGYKSKKRS